MKYLTVFLALYLAFVAGATLQEKYLEAQDKGIEQTWCIRQANVTMCLKGPVGSFKVPTPQKAEPKPKRDNA